MFQATSAGGPVILPPLALFIDFDGTLVELADKPDAIVVPPDLIEEIQNAAERLEGAVAVITGRALASSRASKARPARSGIPSVSR